MLKNYFIIAFRNIRKNNVFSIINITGLAVGLAAAIIILLWIQYETSYDRFHKNHDKLYRVMENQKYGTGSVYTFSATPTPLAAALKKEFADITHATRASWGNTHLFNYKDKHIVEYGLYVDPDFLEMFSFKVLKGQSKTALNQPNSLLISRELAKKYFGDEDPVGKMIRIDEDRQCKITGVFEDVPKNSSLSFDFLMPAMDYIKLYMGNEEEWDDNNIRTFVQLRDASAEKALGAKIKNVVAKNEKEQANVSLFIQPAKDWYLRSEFKDGHNTGGRISHIRLFSIVAIFILLIACINFMNLATAQAAKRGKEVGVRKVMGGDRNSLIRQFLGESLFLTLLSSILAIIIVLVSLPSLNQLLETDLRLELSKPLYIGIFFGIVILTGIIAGSYPALVLSSFQPVRVLKGMTEGIKSRTFWLRKSLVVLQFIISVVMIIGTIIIYQQIQYFKNKNLGYNKENLIYFSSQGISDPQKEAFKSDLLAIPGVISVTRSSINFKGSNNSTSNVKWEGKKDDKEILFSIINTDFDVLKTFNIELKEGRGFSKEFGTDTANYIINEEAAKRMNLTPPIAGQQIELWESKGTIIGVAKDFHISTIHGAIEPIIIQPRSWTWTYYVRIDGQNTPGILSRIAKVHKSRVPEWPLDFKFMDQEYESMYKSEMQIGQLAKWFSILAIFISCLGLFGLVSLAAIQRTKEIGIRKVLGANVSNILTLLSKDFLKLVLIASLIAFPLAWWAMSSWLQDFTYHISIEWWVFAVAGISALFIAILTVSFQAIKAAISNPVKSLRTE